MWQTNFPLPLLSRSRGKARSRNSSIQLLMVATRSWKSNHWLASCSLLPVKHSGYWKCLQTRTKREGLFHSLRLRALVRHTCMPRTRRRPWLVHHVRFCPALKSTAPTAQKKPTRSFWWPSPTLPSDLSKEGCRGKTTGSFTNGRQDQKLILSDSKPLCGRSS